METFKFSSPETGFSFFIADALFHRFKSMEEAWLLRPHRASSRQFFHFGPNTVIHGDAEFEIFLPGF